jgi:hypothetical protein
MRSIAILDASALFAAADRAQAEHARCVDVLRRRDLDFVIPALVVAEVAYLIGSRAGPREEATFVRGLERFAIDPPNPDEWPVIADLVQRYRDFPLGTVDASIAVLADRLDTDLIVTLDRRHFGAIQSPQGRHFRLLPEAKQVHEETAAYSPAPA